jgi:hypothetical protein
MDSPYIHLGGLGQNGCGIAAGLLGNTGFVFYPERGNGTILFCREDHSEISDTFRSMQACPRRWASSECDSDVLPVKEKHTFYR